ncbi:MAG: ParB/RepB/Spo0J family partition protein [bacterium]|nr:ParB/RepB/Spo0J family partition protein [bacterium]
MIRSTLDQLTSAARSSKARQVLEISVDAVDPDPDQPRKTFEDLDDLKASIVAIGIKQPLLVRAHPQEPKRYLLIAGERRLRAARLAGLLTVPCLVETRDVDPGKLLLTQLTENLQRKDVAILETANALRRALEASKLSKGDLARALGKNASFVSKHLALLKAGGPAREALEEGLLLSAETYRQFATLSEASQRNLLTQARLNGEPISRSQVKTALQGKAESAPPKVGKARPEARKAAGKRPPAKANPGTVRFSFRLSADQVRQIIRRFEAEPPTELAELKPALMNLLQ